METYKKIIEKLPGLPEYERTEVYTELVAILTRNLKDSLQWNHTGDKDFLFASIEQIGSIVAEDSECWKEMQLDLDFLYEQSFGGQYDD